MYGVVVIQVPIELEAINSTTQRCSQTCQKALSYCI